MPTAVHAPSALRGGHEQARPRISQPLQYSGSLEGYSKSDLTPVIEQEFSGLQVADILKSEESDRLIRDLAVTSTPLFSLKRVCSNDGSFATRSGLFTGSRCHTPADAKVRSAANSFSWMCKYLFTLQP